MTTPYPPATLATNHVNISATYNVHTSAHNALADAVNSVVAELGSNPSGTYSTVEARLAAMLDSNFVSTILAKMTFVGDSTIDPVIGVRVAGDAADRLTVFGGGSISFGDGTNALDIDIARVAADRLAIDSSLAAGAAVFGGAPTTDAPIASTRATILTAVADVVGLVVKGFTSQTADLVRLSNSAGTVLTRFDASGNLLVGNASGAGGGAAVVALESGTAPGSNPSSGGILHAIGADLFWRGSSGVVSQITGGGASGGSNFIKEPVRVVSTSNITLSGTQTIDSVALSIGDRVLVVGQSTASANGIYVVASGSWTRATDADSTADMASGLIVMVKEGSEAGALWTLETDGAITLGSTSLTFYNSKRETMPMTRTARDALSAGQKPDGRLIYNSTNKRPEFWNGTSFKSLRKRRLAIM